MLLAGRGHPAIRATHAKTLELTPDAEITERATCVVAVDVAAQPARIAGPVRITITADGEAYALEAVGNSGWDPAGTAVIRRSSVRLPGTLATDASAAASDIPRPLVESLRSPDTLVEVLIEQIPGPPTAVLYALDPVSADPARLHAELAAADLIVAEDEDAGRMVGERVAHGQVEVDGRVLVVATREVPGRSVVDALRTVRVETVGLRAPLAAAAASPARGPLLLVPDGADPRSVLRGVPAGTRIVVSTTGERLPDLLATVAELRGPTGAVVLAAHSRPVRLEPGDRPRPGGRETVHVCLDAVSADDATADPAVRAAAEGLLADGVPTKAVARALATLTGWPQRRAYDAVLGWRR